MAIAEETPVFGGDEDLHPAVQLLLARMESNPEEFATHGRWRGVLNTCGDLCSEAEKKVINERVRVIRMDELHVTIMKIMTADPEEDAKEEATSNSASAYGIVPQSQLLAKQAQLAATPQAVYDRLLNSHSAAMQSMQGLQGLQGSRPSMAIFDEYQSIGKEQTPETPAGYNAPSFIKTLLGRK